MAQRRDLRGAFGVPAPPLPAAALAHPDRILRFHRIQLALWAVRLGIVASVLTLLILIQGGRP